MSRESQHVIPESLGGKIIPCNAFDLMQELRSHEKMEAVKSRQQQIRNRQTKQEMRQETIERQLMTAEDYTFTEEGKYRLRAMEERLTMESEDLRSFHMNKEIRENSILDYRLRVRREAEERLRLEEVQREERRNTARKRREAIVAQIRKKQQEEERRLQEAAAAKMREIESRRRFEEDAAEALRAHRAAMTMEDELSAINEQFYLEQLEKKEWLRQEAEKLAQWEREQQLQDEIEMKKRQQKLRDLEEKKLKLAELRKSHHSQGPSTRQSDLSNARNEALRLSKQMRIQNKAKFVSKKRKGMGSSQKDSRRSSLASDQLNPLSPQNAGHIICDISSHGKGKKVLTGCGAMEQNPGPLSDISKYESLRSEMELHCALKELMVEKRGLRLELMQKKYAASSQKEAAEVRECHERIRQIGILENFVRDRVDHLVKKERNEDSDVCVTGADDSNSGNENVCTSRRFSTHSNTTMSLLQPKSNLYHDIENIVREIKELLLKSEVLNFFHCSFELSVVELDAFIRNANLLRMKANAFVEKIKQDSNEDINGYENKLDEVLRKLHPLLERAEKCKSDSSTKIHELASKSDVVHTSADSVYQYPILESKSVPTLRSPGMGKVTVDSLTTSSPQAIHSQPISRNVVISDGETYQSPKRPSLGLGKLSANVFVQESTTLCSDVDLSPTVTQRCLTSDCVILDAASSQQKMVQSFHDPKVAVSMSSDVSSSTVPSQPPLQKELHVAETRWDAVKKVVTPILKESIVETNIIELSTTGDFMKDRAGSCDVAIEEVSGSANDEDDEYCVENADYENIEGWHECIHTTMATAAHHAAYYGFTKVLDVLSRYFDVFIMDSNGRTPLFYASLRNNLDCVLLLVSIEPLWIEVGDVNGETCMHAAVKADGEEVLQFLLTCDVDSTIANNDGLTPAHLAKSFPVLSALYESNSTLYCVDSQSRMPLWYACKDGLAENVDLLCKVMPPEYITWQDDDGNTPLHIACMFGQSDVVEVISMWLGKLEDFYIQNKKNYTPAHVATTADVLKKLYEFGVDLWVADLKGRYPLFINSFQGRADCVSFLIERGVSKNVKFISAKDKQGDTALHAACMCGHVCCAVLLLYWVDNDPNKKDLTPLMLAERAGHQHIARLIEYVESKRANGELSEEIFQCGFDNLAAVTLAHGSRWTKLYDHVNDAVYYHDRIQNISQWDRPRMFDQDAAFEAEVDCTREILIRFYNIYNKEKLSTINDIIDVYQGNFSGLFLQLAERYQVHDFSIFA